MSDKVTTFKELKLKLNEIVDHYDELDYLNFDAKLKNGNKFNFNYDSKSFDNPQKTLKHGYHPISVFNAIIDILASCIMISFLAVTAVKAHLNGMTLAMVINTFIFFILYFIVSAIYHFFDQGSRARKPLYLVRFGLSNVPLILLLSSLFIINDTSKVFFILTFAFAALSVFFISFGTKFGQRAANSSYIAYAIIILVIAKGNVSLTGIAIMLIIAGLIPMLTPSRWHKPATNGVFLVATVSFFFQYLLLL